MESQLPELCDAFGRDAGRAINEWAKEQSTRLLVVQQLTDGQTDARVAIVVEQPAAGPPRKLVVKVCPPDEGTGKLREPGRHLEALRFSPTFAKRHLVGLVYESLRVGGGEWVPFQEFAGGGAPDTFPLSKLLDSVWSRRGRPGSLCTADEFASVCKTVVSAMLREWVAAKGNPEDNRVVDVGTFLGWHLDGRHEPGGSLHRWAMSCAPDLLDPSNGRSAFVQGHENPLSLVTNPSLSRNLKVWPLLGPRHGDLHPANILVPVGNLHLAVKRRRRSPASD